MAQAGSIRPGQPGFRVSENRRAVFLQRDEVLERIDAGIDARQDEAREHAGDMGAVLALVEQRVFALPNEQLERPLHQVVVEWRLFDMEKSAQITMPS